MKEAWRIIKMVFAAVQETRQNVGQDQTRNSYFENLLITIAKRGLSVKSQPCAVLDEDGLPGMVKWVDIVIEDIIAVEVICEVYIEEHHKDDMKSLMEDNGFKNGIIVNFSAGESGPRAVVLMLDEDLADLEEHAEKKKKDKEQTIRTPKKVRIRNKRKRGDKNTEE